MDLGDTHDPLVQLGDALRSARRRLRLSQRELARELGMDHGAVGRWESGRGPAALARVDGALRMLGYRLVVVPRDAEAVVPGMDDATPHVRDRALRHYPAHLPAFVVGGLLENDWRHHRGRMNPNGPGWTFARRADDRREFPERLGRGNPEPPGQWEPGGPYWWESRPGGRV